MKTRGVEVVTTYTDKGIALPARKTGCSAGYDLAAAEDVGDDEGRERRDKYHGDAADDARNAYAGTGDVI